MRSGLAASLLALLLALPVYAEPAISRLDALLKQNNIPIHGVSGSQASHRIDFKDEATQAQRDQATALANAFDWLDKGDAKPKQFRESIFFDGTIPRKAKVHLYTYMTIITDVAHEPIKLKGAYSELVAEFGGAGGWLDATTQQKIEAHATAAGMPLK